MGEGVSGFLNGAELPAKVNRYVQMLFKSFRDPSLETDFLRFREGFG